MFKIEHEFHKPWFMTWCMFVGMSLVLLLHGRKERKETITYKIVLMLSLPAFLDLFASWLCLVGLLYNSASVWQMLRGSMVVFSALISVLVLKRSLHGRNWLGISMSVMGVFIVGMSNFFSSVSQTRQLSEGSSSLVVYGMFCILISQAIQALQVVCEEFFLKNHKIDPFVVVSIEGICGLILTTFIFLPIFYFKQGHDVGERSENTIDTFIQVYKSPMLLKYSLACIISFFFYNIAGILVTLYLSAVHRTMLEASRSVILWLFCLMTGWDVWKFPWSLIELVGFVFLISGQIVYSSKSSSFTEHSIISPAFQSPSAVRYNIIETLEEDSPPGRANQIERTPLLKKQSTSCN